MLMQWNRKTFLSVAVLPRFCYTAATVSPLKIWNFCKLCQTLSWVLCMCSLPTRRERDNIEERVSYRKNLLCWQINSRSNKDSLLKAISVFSKHICAKANRIASNCTRLNLIHILHLFLLWIILRGIIIFSGVANCNTYKPQIFKEETVAAGKYYVNRGSLFLCSELVFGMAGELKAIERREFVSLKIAL